MTTPPAPANSSTTAPAGSVRRPWTILFVCTGNTCRSPMAAAIGRHLLDRSGSDRPGLEMVVRSAGIAAAEGLAATPEAVRAMRDLGVTLDGHGAHALTQSDIEHADMIFTMSPAHVRSILALDPTARSKVASLDPSGGEIPDPLGMGEEVYARTARRLMDLIRDRFAELGLTRPLPEGRAGPVSRGGAGSAIP